MFEMAIDISNKLQYVMTGMAHSTKILAEFIRHKLANYHEPTRRGTPKGSPIGFGRPKYEATLHLLSDSDVKTIASAVGISEGLLRKWKTEKEFQAQIKRNAEEFVDDVVALLREYVRRDHAAFEKFLNSPIKRNEHPPPGTRPESVFGDVANWSRLVLSALRDRWLLVQKKSLDELDNENGGLAWGLADLYDAALKARGKEPVFKELLEPMRNIFFKSEIRTMVETLEKDEPLQLRDRKMMVYRLKKFAELLQ
jgi:hypothetical protein